MELSGNLPRNCRRKPKYLKPFSPRHFGAKISCFWPPFVGLPPNGLPAADVHSTSRSALFLGTFLATANRAKKPRARVPANSLFRPKTIPAASPGRCGCCRSPTSVNSHASALCRLPRCPVPISEKPFLGGAAAWPRARTSRLCSRASATSGPASSRCISARFAGRESPADSRRCDSRPGR